MGAGNCQQIILQVWSKRPNPKKDVVGRCRVSINRMPLKIKSDLGVDIGGSELLVVSPRCKVFTPLNRIVNGRHAAMDCHCNDVFTTGKRWMAV